MRKRWADWRVIRAWARSQATIDVEQSRPHQPPASKAPAAAAMRASSRSRRVMASSSASPPDGISSSSIAVARSVSTLIIVHMFDRRIKAIQVFSPRVTCVN